MRVRVSEIETRVQGSVSGFPLREEEEGEQEDDANDDGTQRDQDDGNDAACSSKWSDDKHPWQDEVDDEACSSKRSDALVCPAPVAGYSPPPVTWLQWHIL